MRVVEEAGGRGREGDALKDVNGHFSVSVNCEQMIVDTGAKHGNRRNKDKSRKIGIIY